MCLFGEEVEDKYISLPHEDSMLMDWRKRRDLQDQSIFRPSFQPGGHDQTSAIHFLNYYAHLWTRCKKDEEEAGGDSSLPDTSSAAKPPQYMLNPPPFFPKGTRPAVMIHRNPAVPELLAIEAHTQLPLLKCPDLCGDPIFVTAGGAPAPAGAVLLKFMEASENAAAGAVSGYVYQWNDGADWKTSEFTFKMTGHD